MLHIKGVNPDLTKTGIGGAIFLQMSLGIFFLELGNLKIGTVLDGAREILYRMLNYKSSILAVSLAFVMASCSKIDFEEEAVSEVAVHSEIAANAVGWQSSFVWETVGQDELSVHYVTIEDDGITTDVADDGLVLLFKRNGASVSSLPIEEGAGAQESATEESAAPLSKYWYHQVSAGNLLITCDDYAKSGTPEGANSFKYFIITPEKLQSLSTEGYTAESLMALDYDAAAALLSATNVLEN